MISLVLEERIHKIPPVATLSRFQSMHWSVRRSHFCILSYSCQLRRPVLGALEHDPLALFQSSSDIDYPVFEPAPPVTAVVDSAIDLFTQLLPLQDLNSTTRTISQLLESLKSPRLEKNAGRKSAVVINAAVAIVQALRNATTHHFRQAKDTFGSTQVTSLLATFLRVRTCITFRS